MVQLSPSNPVPIQLHVAEVKWFTHWPWFSHVCVEHASWHPCSTWLAVTKGLLYSSLPAEEKVTSRMHPLNLLNYQNEKNRKGQDQVHACLFMGCNLAPGYLSSVHSLSAVAETGYQGNEVTSLVVSDGEWVSRVKSVWKLNKING